MLIRSQDKKRLFDISGTTIMIGNENQIEAYGNNQFDVNAVEVLGEYSTEEKAIKVLDMIQEEYLKPKNYCDRTDVEVDVYETKVFQMPSDEEVKV